MTIITVVMMILAGLCLIHYIVIVSYTGLKGSFAYFWLFSALMFVVLTVISALFTKYEMWQSIPKVLIVTVVTVAGVLVLFFISLIGLILSRMKAKPDITVDYLIVLGAKVDGRRITKSLRKRLETAADYLKNNSETMVVVSGGQGIGESISEAEAMAGYLIMAGIEENRILREDKSTSTKENLLLSLKLIKKQNNGECKIAIATNNFHIFRAEAIAKKMGLKNVCGLAAPADPILIINYIFRECAAIVKEKVLGNI